MSKGFIVRRGGEKPEFIIDAGLIVGFAGTDQEIPVGWALCDGSVSSGVTTPDLRSQFIIGAGDEYTVESTGGSANAVLLTHTHILDIQDQTSNHQHGVRQGGYTGGSSLPYFRICWYAQTSFTATSLSNGSHSHTISASTLGVSATNANLPPYRSLHYIVKLEE